MKGANNRLGNYVQKDSPVNILKLNNNFLKFDDIFDNQINHICKAYNFFLNSSTWSKTRKYINIQENLNEELLLRLSYNVDCQ